jgi:hypothetical protein
MKKFPRAKATGKLGVVFVENIVSEASSIFRPIPQDTDVGIDGYIEFVENEIVTGTLVAVQIKAGASFLKQYSDDKYFSINASRADMNYWNSHSIPVALIAYDPTTKLSGWLDITGYILFIVDRAPFLPIFFEVSLRTLSWLIGQKQTYSSPQI